MKTQKIKTSKKWWSFLLLSAIISLSSCGSKTGGAKVNKEQVSSEKVKVNPPNMDIHTATFLGDLNAIKQHIKANSDLDVKEPLVGSSPLITAAVFGKTEIAKVLIEAGADINLQNNEGSTALHSAAFLCRTEIVEMLLEHDADKSIRNKAGSTALASVEGAFSEVKAIYDIFRRDLGPMGLKLDYAELEKTRPIIAAKLK